MSRHRSLVIIAIAVLFAAVFVAHLSLGSVPIPLGQTLRALTGASVQNETWKTIVLDFRLPRAVTAAVAGAALAVGGLLMQTLFRNPLAGPFVLGINAGASLGVAIVVLGGSLLGSTPVAGSGLLAGAGIAGDALLVLAASVGAAAVLLVVLAVARRVESAMTLLVLGVLFSYAVSAGVSVLMHFSIPQEIQTYINWTFGSFAGVDRSQLGLLAGVVGIGLLGTVVLVKPLNALLLGETYASSMGVRIRVVRTMLIAATALLAGTVTAFCGPIAFVGIAVPHLARAILRDADHRRLMPAVLLLGAATAVIADL
ncbi:MAG: iron ABC transporter permease, partial [Spirochaetaceae bacterium]|nr:iron ABC transporter permease [Spirochaetaceae bacterium]